MSDQSISLADGVKWANYILEHSDGPEGMVRTWGDQAARGTATWAMLNNLKQRYEEMTGKTS
jgi:hypothetical protein